MLIDVYSPSIEIVYDGKKTEDGGCKRLSGRSLRYRNKKFYLHNEEGLGYVEHRRLHRYN